MNYSNCKMVEKGAQFIHGNYTGEAYTYAHWQAVKSGRSYGDATFCPAFFWPILVWEEPTINRRFPSPVMDQLSEVIISEQNAPHPLLKNSTPYCIYTVKKGCLFPRPQPGCHLPNFPGLGII
jgi:hypothetical protein